MKEFIEELKYKKNVNIDNGLENKIDIDYVIERLYDINETILYQAYINEIKFYIECQKEYDSVKNNENGVLDYLNSLTNEDLGCIADNMLYNEYLSEQINATIGEYLYMDFKGDR